MQTISHLKVRYLVSTYSSSIDSELDLGVLKLLGLDLVLVRLAELERGKVLIDAIRHLFVSILVGDSFVADEGLS